MEATISPDKEREKTTIDKVRDLRNMSDKQIRDYLASDEFSEHGSKSLKGNATRLLKVLGDGKAKNVTMEDRELLRGALSAMQRASHVNGDKHETAHALTTSKAYGYDPEAGGEEADYGAQEAAPEAGDPGDESDGDDGDEEDTGEDAEG